MDLRVDRSVFFGKQRDLVFELHVREIGGTIRKIKVGRFGWGEFSFGDVGL